MGTNSRAASPVSSSVGTSSGQATASADHDERGGEPSSESRPSRRRSRKKAQEESSVVIPQSYVIAAAARQTIDDETNHEITQEGEILHVAWGQAPRTKERTKKAPWVAFLVTYFVLSSLTIYMLAFHEHKVEKAMKAYIQYTSLPLALVFYAIEPFFLLLQVLLYTHPSPATTEHLEETQGLVFPANTDGEMELNSEEREAATIPHGNATATHSESFYLTDDNERGEGESSNSTTSNVSKMSLDTGGALNAETANLAIVIPCHNTQPETLIRTVESCLSYVRPHQIFVVENGNECHGPSEIRDALCNANLHAVQYLYNPYANKTLALYAGCLAARHYTHILTIDDDVILPSRMVLGTHLIDESVRAVCYPILPIAPVGQRSSSLAAQALITWQRVEYQLSDYSKLLQSFCGSAVYPHGAISLWDRATLIQCCRDHDTVFFADDLKMGWWLQKRGYRLQMLANSVVETAAPTLFWSWAHHGRSSLWRQRVCSWDMAEHVYHGEFFSMLWESQHRGMAGISLGFYQMWACLTLMADWIRLPVTILTIAWNAHAFALWIFVVSMGYIAVLLIWNDMAYRRSPLRRCPILAVMTFPMYKIYILSLRVCGMMRAFVWYLPRFTRPPSIPELEAINFATGDRRPVWLDPKYSKYFDGYIPDQPEAVWK